MCRGVNASRYQLHHIDKQCAMYFGLPVATPLASTAGILRDHAAYKDGNCPSGSGIYDKNKISTAVYDVTSYAFTIIAFVIAQSCTWLATSHEHIWWVFIPPKTPRLTYDVRRTCRCRCTWLHVHCICANDQHSHSLLSDTTAAAPRDCLCHAKCNFLRTIEIHQQNQHSGIITGTMFVLNTGRTLSPH